MAKKNRLHTRKVGSIVKKASILSNPVQRNMFVRLNAGVWSEMVVAPRKVPFAESVDFANTMMRIENPSLTMFDLQSPRISRRHVYQKQLQK